jgi:hypothetical protein
MEYLTFASLIYDIIMIFFRYGFDAPGICPVVLPTYIKDRSVAFAIFIFAKSRPAKPF